MNLTFLRPGDVTEVMKRVAEVAAEPFNSGNLENLKSPLREGA